MNQLALFADEPSPAPAPVVANDAPTTADDHRASMAEACWDEIEPASPETVQQLDPAVRTWALHWLREKAVSWGDEAVPGGLLGCEIECSLRRCIGDDEPYATLDALVVEGVIEVGGVDRPSGERTYRIAQPERRELQDKASKKRLDDSIAKAQAAQPAPRRGRGAKAKAEPAALPTKRLTDRQRELLRGFEVDGLNVARCLLTERVPDFAKVKEVFVALGARWQKGGKKVAGGFAFPDDADGREVLRIALESGEILDPRAAGFFPTPAGLALDLVRELDLAAGDMVLEPSAGRGAIAKAVVETFPGVVVECVELLPDNRKALEALGLPLIGSDFMSLTPEPRFDAVAMNAPFHDRNDVHHTLRAIEWLKPGGRLAAICSAGVLYRSDSIGQSFRDAVAVHGGQIVENPPGSFIESGTGVSTVSVFMTKRGDR